MRKKATTWGIALSLALGVSAIAATSALPSFFGASATTRAGDEGEVTWVSSVPAEGAKVTSTDGVSSVTLTYKGADLTINRGGSEVQPSGDIVLYSVDGATKTELFKIPLSDKAVEYTQNESDVRIAFPSPVVKFGSYELAVPANSFYTIEEKEVTTSEGTGKENVKVWSKAQTLSFTIAAPPMTATYTPAAGLVSNLQDFSVSFPGAEKVEWNGDPKSDEFGDQVDAIKLIQYSTSASTVYTTTAINPKSWTFEGSTVTFSAGQDLYEPYNNNAKQYYYTVTIPKNMLVYYVNGQKIVYDKDITLGQYKIDPIREQTMEVLLPESSQENPLTPEQLESFKIRFKTYKDQVVTIKNASYKVSMKKYFGPSDVKEYATYTIAAVEGEPNTFQLTRIACEDISKCLNNPAMWESGPIMLSIPALTFKSDPMQTVPTTGKPTTAYGNAIINTGGKWYLEAKPIAPGQVQPALGTTISPEFGWNNFKFTTVSNDYLVPGKNVTIYRDGEVYMTFPVDGSYASATKANGSVITWTFPMINKGGNYKIVFEEGAFHAVDYPYGTSGELSFDYTIGANLDCKVTPANYSTLATESKVGALSDKSDLNVITFEYAGADSIKVNPDYIFKLVYNSNSTANLTYANSNAYVYEAKTEGNKLTLTYNPNYIYGTGKTPNCGKQWKALSAASTLYPYYLNIPADVFTVYYPDGKEVKNSQIVNVYRVQSGIGQFPMTWDNESVITPAMLKEGFTVTVPEGYTVLETGAADVILAAAPSATETLPATVYSAQSGAIFTKKYDADHKSVHYSWTGNVNTLPTGRYVISFANGTNVTNTSLAVAEVENGATQPWVRLFNGPMNYYVNYEGVKTANVALEGKTYYDQMPDSLVLSSADGPLSYAGGQKTWSLWALTSAGSYSKNANYEVQQKFVDGKLVLTPVCVKGNPVSFGSFRLVCGNGTGFQNVPVGDLKVGNDLVNAAFNVSFAVPVGINPAPGYYEVGNNTKGISKISFTYDAGQPVAVRENSEAELTVNMVGETTPIAAFKAADLKVDASARTITAELPKLIDTQADFEVKVPAGLLYYTLFDTDVEAFTFGYQVRVMPDGTITGFTPAENSVIDGFTALDVVFSDLEKVNGVRNGEVAPSLKIEGPAGTVSGIKLAAAVNEAENGVSLTPAEPTDLPSGKYTVTIPGHSFAIIDYNGTPKEDYDDRGYWTPDTTVNFTVVRPTAYEVSPKASEFVKEVKQFAIRFEGMNKLAAVVDTVPVPATVSYGETVVESTAALVGDSIVITPAQPLTAFGTYKVSVPAMSLYLWNETTEGEEDNEGGETPAEGEETRAVTTVATPKTWNSAVDYTFDLVDQAVLASASVEAGAVVSQFEGVTLSISTPAEFVSLENKGDITLSYHNPLDTFADATVLELEAVPNPDGESVLLTVTEETEKELKEAGKWPIKTTGEYTVTVGAKSFVLTDKSGNLYGAPEWSVKYDVVSAVPYTATPVDGVYQETVSDFTFTFEGMGVIYPTAEDGVIPVSLTTGEGEETTAVEATAAIDGNKVVVTPKSILTSEAKYTVKLPAMSLALAADSTAVPVWNQAIDYSYTILHTPKMTRVYPAEGSKLSFFCNVDLTFDMVVSKNRAYEGEPATVSVNGEVVYALGNEDYGVHYNPEDVDNMIQFNFTNSKKVMVPGEYKVHIPAGFFKLGGSNYTTNKEITLEYTLVKLPNMIVTPTVNSVVTEISRMAFHFPDADKIELNPNATSQDGDGNNIGLNLLCTATASKSSYDAQATNFVFDEANKVVYCEFPYTDDPGKYVMRIPSNLFKVWENGVECAAWNPNDLLMFYIEEFTAPDILPAPGGVKASALNDDITVTLPAGYNFGWINHTTRFKLFKADDSGAKIAGEEVKIYEFDAWRNGGYVGAKYDNEPHSIVLTDITPETVLEPGNYVFQLQGYSWGYAIDPYTIDGELDEGGTVTADITYEVVTSPFYYNYVVTDSDIPAMDAIFTPASGNVEADALKTITVNYPNYEDVIINNWDARLVAGKSIIYLEHSVSGNTVTYTVPVGTELTAPYYQLRLPQGSTTLVAGEQVVPASVEYADYIIPANIVIPAIEPVVKPEAGEVKAKDLQNIRIVYPNFWSIEVNGPITLSDGETSIALEASTLKNILDLSVPAGTDLTSVYYRLNIPADALTLEVYGETVKAPALVADYTIVANVPEAVATVAPADGIVAPEELQAIVLTYADFTKVEINETEEEGGDEPAAQALEEAVITLTNGETSLMLIPTVQGNKVILGTDETIAEGEWSLNVPAGYFKVFYGEIEKESLEVNAAWTALNVPEVVATVTPEAGTYFAEDLTVITVTYAGFESVKAGEGEATLKSGSENVALTAAYDADKVTLTLGSQLTAAGNYTLNVPAGAFVVSYKGAEVEVPAFTVEYVVNIKNGLTELFGEGARLNVYTVNGVLVLRDATVEEAAQLDGGLYIINGKKVYLRK